jgi:hypothetical protein
MLVMHVVMCCVCLARCPGHRYELEGSCECKSKDNHGDVVLVRCINTGSARSTQSVHADEPPWRLLNLRICQNRTQLGRSQQTFAPRGCRSCATLSNGDESDAMRLAPEIYGRMLSAARKEFISTAVVLAYQSAGRHIHTSDQILEKWHVENCIRPDGNLYET